MSSPNRGLALGRKTDDRPASAGFGDCCIPEHHHVPCRKALSRCRDTDDRGRRLSCTDYARDGYTLAGYLAAYDPATWGWDEEPRGPLEDARRASGAVQSAQISVPIGSNTTIIGLPGARITGANLRINNASNVIIRGLTLTDAGDCFPEWDPTDGETGNWNSAYDLISLTGATNVWVEHNDLSDGANPDSAQPVYFGRPYQVHDGAWTSRTPPTWSPCRTTGSMITTRRC